MSIAVSRPDHDDIMKLLIGMDFLETVRKCLTNTNISFGPKKSSLDTHTSEIGFGFEEEFQKFEKMVSTNMEKDYSALNEVYTDPKYVNTEKLIRILKCKEKNLYIFRKIPKACK